MFRNITRTTDKDLHQPIGALLAGSALLTLPVLRLIYASAEPIELGYWMPLFFGVAMMLHGIAAVLHQRINVTVT